MASVQQGQFQFLQWLTKTATKVRARAQKSADTTFPTTTTDRSQDKGNAGKEFFQGSAWRQWQQMADLIVRHGKPRDLSDAPINTLRDVIQLRKKSAHFFGAIEAQSCDPQLKAQNQGHKHMINVLEQILDKLEATIVSHRYQERQSSAIDQVKGQNVFSYLDVELVSSSDEVDDVLEPNPGSSTQNGSQAQEAPRLRKKKGSPEPKPTPCKPSESTDLEEDDVLPFWYCFFKEINKLADYVCERWADNFYGDRPVHINTLAVVSNSAIELFRHVERDYTSAVSQVDPPASEYHLMIQNMIGNMVEDSYGSAPDLNDVHCTWDTIAKSAKSAKSACSGPEQTRPEIIYDDWYNGGHGRYLALVPAVCLMYKFLPESRHGRCPPLPPSLAPKWAERYGSHSYGKETTLIYDLVEEDLGEATFLKEARKYLHISNVPAQPELLMGIEKALSEQIYKRRSTIAAWLAFAMQLQVDIRMIMEHKVEDAFRTMQETATRLVQTLDRHLISTNDTRAYKHADLQTLHDHLESFYLTDITCGLKQKLFDECCKDIGKPSETAPRFAPHKVDPVWSGLLDFRAKLVASELGQAFARQAPVIEAAAYVYHAAKAASEESFPQRLDMAKFLDTYDDEHSQFKRGILDALDSSSTILGNWEGVLSSLTEELRNERQYSKSVRVRDIFLKRYQWRRKQPHCSLQDSLDFISELSAEMKPTWYPQDCGGLRDIAAQQVPQQEKPCYIPPLQILKMVEEATTSLVDGLLTLDYFKLWDESVALLEAVGEGLGAEFQARIADAGKRPETYAMLPMWIADELGQEEIGDGGGQKIIDVLVSAVKMALKEKDSV